MPGATASEHHLSAERFDFEQGARDECITDGSPEFFPPQDEFAA
jgi:hypothetical protein